MKIDSEGGFGEVDKGYLTLPPAPINAVAASPFNIERRFGLRKIQPQIA
jgi:hypothetical protein